MPNQKSEITYSDAMLEISYLVSSLKQYADVLAQKADSVMNMLAQFEGQKRVRGGSHD